MSVHEVPLASLDLEMQYPTGGQGGRAIGTEFNSNNKATADKVDQPETALAAAFRKAIARKAVAP
jgi:hypothetical protein